MRRAARLHQQKRDAETEALPQIAISRDPGNPDLRNARGAMFAAMERHLDGRCDARSA
ncbi:MAG TPA: hypothetical protein VM711_04785 [Sphingomicrobium sp.]|nr:hypothetical protein [Sphingomicrobium sp.]